MVRSIHTYEDKQRASSDLIELTYARLELQGLLFHLNREQMCVACSLPSLKCEIERANCLLNSPRIRRVYLNFKVSSFHFRQRPQGCYNCGEINGFETFAIKSRPHYKFEGKGAKVWKGLKSLATLCPSVCNFLVDSSFAETSSVEVLGTLWRCERGESWPNAMWVQLLRQLATFSHP